MFPSFKGNQKREIRQLGSIWYKEENLINIFFLPWIFLLQAFRIGMEQYFIATRAKNIRRAFGKVRWSTSFKTAI